MKWIKSDIQVNSKLLSFAVHILFMKWSSHVPCGTIIYTGRTAPKASSFFGVLQNGKLYQRGYSKKKKQQRGGPLCAAIGVRLVLIFFKKPFARLVCYIHSQTRGIGVGSTYMPTMDEPHTAITKSRLSCSSQTNNNNNKSGIYSYSIPPYYLL